MPQFAYKARRRTGEVVQGVIDVADRAAALAQIERLGLFPVMVDASRAGVAAVEKSEKAKDGGAKRSVGMPALFGQRRQRRPKLQELATFTTQLANLLKCGMPLTVALQSMTHLESKGIPSDVSKTLKQEVMEGRSLSDAMAKQPVVFSDLYRNMVQAGEQSGALVEVLKRLASHFERFAEVQSKFMSALIYPIIVACVGVVIIIFFMTFMLPKFMSIFTGLNVPLPLATKVLMNFSQFFAKPTHWIVMGLVGSVAVVVWVRFRATPEGKRKIDSWKMNAPIVGKVVQLNLFGQFARTLSTLLVNGVPVLLALKITEEIVPNTIVKEAIARTREQVTDGKTIAQPLGQSKLFPQLMIDLLKIGEETGDVPGALQNIAETYENELSLQLRVLTNLIEPAMIIVMAVGVGGLLFSILSAMFAITSSLNR
ncbi:MAG TPA: type II secretion system F family protein [Candidatus Saccharimonadales bacterium]|nr:type II secretion system F family protein [Candidatus Saccharimonadales bacterium]